MGASCSVYSLLWQARRRQSLNHFLDLLRESRFLLTVIIGFVVGYWVFFTWLFCRGIRFVQFEIPGLGDLLLSRMFYVLFALIFFMLVTSSMIVGYGVFFRNPETAWLQTLPVSHGRLLRWKFLEMSVLASWAFIFLSGPLLLAYGIVLKLPWSFQVGVLILYLPFSLLANVVGAALVLWLVSMWHHRAGRWVVLLCAAMILGIAYWLFEPIDVMAMREAEIVPLMNMMLKNTRAVATPLLPSYWLASAVIGLGEKLWIKPLFFFSVTLSYTLLAGWLVLRYGGRLFYEDASRVQDRRLHGRAHALRSFVSPLSITGNLLVGWMGWLKLPIRAILVKDWITFWRDASQWSQFAIFFGLLGFYFLNLRNLRYHLDERFWVSVVAFMNLTSLSLILATLTTRFVFPQFSLEGRRLWLVGLAPVRLGEIVWGKFWASSLICGGVTTLMMFFSFSSLQLDADLRRLITFTVVMMSFGLSGIAVGMGVLFPNLKQPNAAQIVSGLGGTFCLVLSLGYVAVAVVTVALPMHLRHMAGQSLEFSFTSPVGVVYTVLFVVSLTAAIVPMRLAEKQLASFEF